MIYVRLSICLHAYFSPVSQSGESIHFPYSPLIEEKHAGFSRDPVRNPFLFKRRQRLSHAC
jgi:hypothetical protein